MKKISLLMFIVLASFRVALCQTSTLITVNYQKDDFFKDSFMFQIRKSGQPEGLQSNYLVGKLLKFESNTNWSTSVSNYQIPDTVCTIFGLGFGHEIIVIPNDTITITVNPAKSDHIANDYYSPWLHEFSYEGRNRFIYSLFDSLAQVGGELIWGEMSFKAADYDLNTFFRNVTDCYNRRLKFLIDYSVRHNIPSRILAIAKSESYAAYISNLFTPLNVNPKLKKEELPAAYLAVLKDARFSDPDNYFSSKLYKNATYALALFNATSGTLNDVYSDGGMIMAYEYIKSKYVSSLRDDLLTHHLARFIGAPELYPSFATIFSDFEEICSDKDYLSFISMLYERKKNDTKRGKPLKEVLAAVIFDSSGKSTTLKNLLHDKPLLIDCWASWCGPCLSEIPTTKKLQKKYQGKVDFIYLSFDKSLSKWKGKVKELKLQKGFLLENNFKSDFARHFRITGIPRYILIGKNGSVIEEYAARPDNKKLLEQLLNKNL